MEKPINISQSRGRVIFPVLLLFFLSAIFGACENPKKTQLETKEEVISVEIPDFQADSAYAYIAKQLDFGPRVPNTGSHINCGEWLGEFLENQGAKLYRQTTLVTAFNGDQLAAQNIIASFNPTAKKRIMLSAHWDTRPFAEQDTERKDEPIPGANDGASGVGVLLEIARQLKHQPPTAGIDIFLWDAEDYGNPGALNSYSLGSQYWAKNPHVPNYLAQYGVNLDMVGAEGAKFNREQTSMQYASGVIEKVWMSARRQGYESYFSHVRSNPVTDDHLYINTLAKIPCIDIIDQRGESGFFEHWHTHQDDLSVISKATLKAVGQTVLDLIYRE